MGLFDRLFGTEQQHDAPAPSAHYLCYPSRKQVPLRVRVCIDDMTTQLRALDLSCTAPLQLVRCA